jgi:hypothetical protein
MQDYEAIQEYIRRARIERSVYLAELIADGIVRTWKIALNAADVLLTVARVKPRNNVFTFDA